MIDGEMEVCSFPPLRGSNPLAPFLVSFPSFFGMDDPDLQGACEGTLGGLDVAAASESAGDAAGGGSGVERRAQGPGR